MARLDLPPEEWLEMHEVLLRVPAGKRDEKWDRAMEAVEAMCGAIDCLNRLLDRPKKG